MAFQTRDISGPKLRLQHRLHFGGHLRVKFLEDRIRFKKRIHQGNGDGMGAPWKPYSNSRMTRPLLTIGTGRPSGVWKSSLASMPSR
jgi:hypothetical protein